MPLPQQASSCFLASQCYNVVTSPQNSTRNILVGEEYNWYFEKNALCDLRGILWKVPELDLVRHMAPVLKWNLNMSDHYSPFKVKGREIYDLSSLWAKSVPVVHFCLKCSTKWLECTCGSIILYADRNGLNHRMFI